MEDSMEVIRLLFGFLNNAILFLLIGYVFKRIFDKADKSDKTHIKTEMKDYKLEVVYDENEEKEEKN